jgi:energy-coupling factor transporter ATP-binding protein EcfA2
MNEKEPSSGEAWCILAPSGTGKSTIVRTLEQEWRVKRIYDMDNFAHRTDSDTWVAQWSDMITMARKSPFAHFFFGISDNWKQALRADVVLVLYVDPDVIKKQGIVRDLADRTSKMFDERGNLLKTREFYCEAAKNFYVDLVDDEKVIFLTGERLLEAVCARSLEFNGNTKSVVSDLDGFLSQRNIKSKDEDVRFIIRNILQSNLN